ncbi:T9SS type A sorting domain-containing protein [Flavobacterium microcysteis]|uniref:T9SS type A sorting domain-containing protein n=1 Tax=Flavobacterium microcysteis TaxID=2596891 RepID=A0A501QIL1_9FLAO|nr:T9SS type A sorting domain-containing protein [Flavobacterium microcysteis]TPD72288.1 T9SS type A sorting domain-containing protein [Flavobacterium microcysteis]
MNTTLHKKLILPFLFILCLLFPTSDYAQILGWDANNTGGGFGTSPWTPATRNANLQTSGLVRGSSIATSGTPAGNCWGGSGGWSTGQSDSNSFYFTFQAAAGYKVSLSSISTATRRSNSGPSGCVVYYSIGGGPFTSVASWSTSSTSGTTGTPNSVSLAGISALQNIAAGVVVKFRIIPQGSTGNYYLTGGTNSLKIDGSVVAAVNPLITPSTTSLASFGDVMVGNNSTATSFTFNGVGLTDDVSILAPAGFEISTDGINWYPGTDISPVGGTLNNVQVWVRFSPTSVGTASGNIVLSSPGATSKTVAVTGNGIPAVSSIVVDDEPYGPYCNGIDNTFDLDFTPAGTFNSVNFYAQLSNADGSFPTTPTNFVGVSATSPITVTIPADITPGSNYRVRVYNEDPLTFSNNDNGHNITVTGAATLSGVTQSNILCDGGTTTINLTGLIPDSTSSISYTINNGTAQNVAGILADASGNASFTVSIPYSNNGQSLVVGTIERTDVASCPNTLAANNSVVLTVHPSPTVTAATTTALCGTNDNAVISLTGLIASSTSDITYTIAGGTAVTVTGIIANASGEGSFEVPVLSTDNGLALEITSITRTDLTPNCQSTLTGVSTLLVINSRPTAVISGDQSICQGSTSSDLSIALTGTAPWTITYTDGTSTFPISNILTSPYTFTVTVTETKTYTVTAAEDANCVAQTADMSGSATVTVVEASNGGTITGSTTVCFEANNGTLTLADHVGSIIKWQSSNVADFSGTVIDIQNTTTTLDYTNLSETTYYRAVVQNAPCAETNSALATITVNQTEAPTTATQTFCNAATVNELLPNATGIQWYDTPTGGTALPLTQALASGDYYATMTIDGCESARTLTSVILNTVTAPTTAAQTFCNAATVNELLPNATGIQWYDAPTGGTALPLTQALASGDYYATMTVDGCESARTLTSVILNTVTAPTTAAQTFCNAATVNELLPNTTGILWYDAPTGGTALPLTQALASGDYYATMTIDGCESARTLTSVTLNTVTAPTTTSQTFCNAATVNELLPNTTGIQWYDAPTGGTALPLTQALASGDYYATITIDGCESARTLTSVTLNTVTAPTTAAQNFCNAATVNELLPNAAGIKWYDAPTGGTALPLTQALASGDYYATMTIDGCESPRTLTSVTLNSAARPNGNENQDFIEGETLAALEVTGTNLVWYATEAAAEAGTPTLGLDELLVDGATYYAVQTINGCSSNPLAVTVSMMLSNPDFDLKNLKAYPNPVTDILSISYSENIISVEVFNLIGQKIMDKTTNNTQVTINLSDVETGAYLIRVSSGKTQKTFRILKK